MKISNEQIQIMIEKSIVSLGPISTMKAGDITGNLDPFAKLGEIGWAELNGRCDKQLKIANRTE